MVSVANLTFDHPEDGFHDEKSSPTQESTLPKQKVLQRLPERVVKDAKALAIFTTVRTGVWKTGSGGSGVLVARLPDGSWSPPSGILIHTTGLGFIVGVDVYDCIVVINSEQAFDAFTQPRCTLGAEMQIRPGPLDVEDASKPADPVTPSGVYTYTKSRGFNAKIQIDGSVIMERADENERFYGEALSSIDILNGKTQHHIDQLHKLAETLKAAEGSQSFDVESVPTEAPPSEYDIEHAETFGVPDKDDPDPYGVLALEKEGMSLKEAGNGKRASWEQFQFNPSPTSPIHTIYARQSSDNMRPVSQRTSWRVSGLSNGPKTPSSLRISPERAPSVTMSDMSTQTDFPQEALPSPTVRSVRSSRGDRSSKSSLVSSVRSAMPDVPEHKVLEPFERREPESASHINGYTTPPSTPPTLATIPPLPLEAEQSSLEPTVVEEVVSQLEVVGDEDEPETKQETFEQHEGPAEDEDDADEEDEDEEDEEEAIVIIEAPVVHSFQQAQLASAQVVSVAKRLPPVIPPRNPSRNKLSISTPAPVTQTSPSDAEVSSPAAKSPSVIEEHDSNDLERQDESMPVLTGTHDVKIDSNEPAPIV
jgi:lipid-binding SYLF domain-containing protein